MAAFLHPRKRPEWQKADVGMVSVIVVVMRLSHRWEKPARQNVDAGAVFVTVVVAAFPHLWKIPG